MSFTWFRSGARVVALALVAVAAVLVLTEPTVGYVFNGQHLIGACIFRGALGDTLSTTRCQRMSRCCSTRVRLPTWTDGTLRGDSCSERSSSARRRLPRPLVCFGSATPTPYMRPNQGSRFTAESSLAAASRSVSAKRCP